VLDFVHLEVPGWLSGRVAGLPQPGVSACSLGRVAAGQGACGMAWMRCQAVVIASAHGHDAAIFRSFRRPPWTRRAAACRIRSVLGSALARSLSRASSFSQASRMAAIMDAASHAWLTR
jgi:hypothetical protein